RSSMEKLSSGDNHFDKNAISKMMIDWVNGETISYIADKYFLKETDARKRIEKCSRAMYSHLANAATWGLAAIQKIPNSGADWGSLTDMEKKKMANLPALLHYGVNSDGAVLMRKSNIPRRIANKVGELYSKSVGDLIFSRSSNEVSTWLNSLDSNTWEKVRPANSVMTGTDYKRIWEKLNGIE
ncbi:MAG TPA: hypothetical protein VFX43_01520, partial [Chitinophagaceae bacterium]|nr:hypothetical protein [Chitinophagaceae bacterium]